MKFSLPKLFGSKQCHDTKEFVMFLPGIAFERHDGTVAAHIQAWAYVKEKRRLLTHILKIFLGFKKSAFTASQRKQFEMRLKLFGVAPIRGKRILLFNGSNRVQQMPKTARNGQSETLIPISLSDKAHIKHLTFQAATDGELKSQQCATAIFSPLRGRSVISDIDDTIKISSVSSKTKLLKNTFLEEFLAVEDMAAFYRYINRYNDVGYHYVSSSPIELYPALKDFMASTGYPVGTVHLREITNWRHLFSLSDLSRDHKMRSIQRILQAYPKRHFFLIGDSTENDAEIYANFKSRFPQQILAIIIRNVSPDIPIAELERPFLKLSRRNWIITPSVDEMRDFVAGFD